MKIFITRTLVLLLALVSAVTASGAFPPALMAATGPDLVIEEISTSPIEPALGEQITITVAVKNLGETTAAATLITCYLDDTILDTEPVETLEPGIATTVAFTWTANGGSHTVKAIADVNGTLAETDETNNTGTYALTTLAADLAIEAIAWTPANPSRDDNITISIIIQNQGTYRSKYSNFNFLIDGASRGISEIAPMEPGTSLIKTITWIALAGEHTFTAVVDEADTTREGDETNNESSITFNTMAPDLAVESISWTPEPPSKDDIVSFDVTIINLGAGRADVSNLAYYIDNLLIGSLQVPALNAGDSTIAAFTWRATLDAHNVRAVIDYVQAITETNESNNELNVSLITQPCDLVMTDVSWLPVKVSAGDDVTFTATLTNQGGGNAEASRTALFINNRMIGLMDFAPIDAGEEDSATITWTAEGGVHRIEFISDYFTKITESNEKNNRYNTSLTAALPDLVISGITFLPEKPMLDETVTITIAVKNQGDGDAPGSRIACFLDDTQETVKMIKPLEGGESAFTTYQWKVKSGHHVLRALADDDNNVWEADEKNNSNTVNIAPNLPDLAITNVSWSPADIIPGQEIIFNMDIENIGGVDAGVSRIVFYTDETISGYNDIDPVKAGEKTTCTFIWAAAEGRHTVSIGADSRGQITEIDEQNNTITISIPPPDLTVQDITFSPQVYLTGDTVTITANIINLKGNDTPGSTAKWYIDDLSTGTMEVPPLAAGERYDISFEWTAEAGVHTFEIAADTGNTVMEIDETNNKALTVSSTTTPDLEVDSINWKISSHLNSTDVTFTALLKNTGNCESGGFSMGYSFNNGPETVQKIASIPGSGTAELVFTAIFSKGEHNGDIILDINEEISETDESNNSYSFTFSTIAPDLVVRTITWGPVTANIGDNVTISAKVENIGLTKAENIYVVLSIDGTATSSISVAEIDTGSMVTLDFPWTALAGEHTIDVFADASHSGAECDETNNTRHRIIAFTQQEAQDKAIPIINPAATTGGGLLEKWWWLLLVIGGLLGLTMIYLTIRNMRK